MNAKLVIALFLVSVSFQNALAEFEEGSPQAEKSYRVVRPTVICQNSAEAVNAKLKPLPVGSYTVSSMTSNLVVGFSDYGYLQSREKQFQVCVVVSPK